MTRRPFDAGFTLVELLVAITILAVVAVLGWRGLDAIVRARISLSQEMEQSRGLQLAFSQLQSDTARVVRSSDIGGRVPLQVIDDRLQLVRTVLVDDQPTQVQVVSYRLRDGVLVRSESAATRDLTTLDALWQSFAEDKAGAVPVALQKQVAGLRMRTWLAGASSWVTALSGAVQGGAPVAVKGLEVTLELAGQPVPLTKVLLVGGEG